MKGSSCRETPFRLNVNEGEELKKADKLPTIFEIVYIFMSSCSIKSELLRVELLTGGKNHLLATLMGNSACVGDAKNTKDL